MGSPSERVGKNHGFSGTSNTKWKNTKNALFSLKMAIGIWKLVKYEKIAYHFRILKKIEKF